uniref:Large ribosomal subunit protein uL3 n=1 Tax=Ignisphaera aggregans TaxID=334771 RepID=A0A7C4FGB8_9CREN
MAHRKTSAPKRGSLGVRPRKRATEFIPRVKSWPLLQLETPRVLGFIGYKVGMTHVILVDDRPGTPTQGKEVFVPVTIIETPPAIPIAVRVYGINEYGGYSLLKDVWIEPPKEIEIWRRIPAYRPSSNISDRIEWIKNNLQNIKRVSLVMAANVKAVGGLSKKTPDILEVVVEGGDVAQRVTYSLEVLGKTIHVDTVFNPGQFIDIIGVTKGKGFQGVIKRFGVKELPRWHKHRKGSRRIGSRSPTIGAMSEVPQPGQMGFHRRTEFNKRIIAIGDSGYEITPSGGFPHYGIVKSKWLMIWGSCVGVPKRPLILRWPIRPPRWQPSGSPKIVYISL